MKVLVDVSKKAHLLLEIGPTLGSGIEVLVLLINVIPSKGFKVKG